MDMNESSSQPDWGGGHRRGHATVMHGALGELGVQYVAESHGACLWRVSGVSLACLPRLCHRIVQ